MHTFVYFRISSLTVHFKLDDGDNVVDAVVDIINITGVLCNFTLLCVSFSDVFVICCMCTA